MSQNFEVIAADPKDLAGISLLLKQRALHPDESLWEQYCKTMADPEPRGTRGAAHEETSLIVIDKIGASRGFCIVRQRRHPNYPRLLDVPVIAIEKGPNENEIARAIFDHLFHFAQRQNCHAVRFGASTPQSWHQRIAPDYEMCSAGTIMPLNIDPQRQHESSKPSSAGSPIPRQFDGRSFDQSRSYRTDVTCSPRWYSRISA
jgi:hypothetical protein